VNQITSGKIARDLTLPRYCGATGACRARKTVGNVRSIETAKNDRIASCRCNAGISSELE
jgi:hypothetical protein